jgi:hypothetical protein
LLSLSCFKDKSYRGTARGKGIVADADDNEDEPLVVVKAVVVLRTAYEREALYLASLLVRASKGRGLIDKSEEEARSASTPPSLTSIGVFLETLTKTREESHEKHAVATCIGNKDWIGRSEIA